MEILKALPVDIQRIIYSFYVDKWFDNNKDIFQKQHFKRYRYVLDDIYQRFHPKKIHCNLFASNLIQYYSDEEEDFENIERIKNALKNDIPEKEGKRLIRDVHKDIIKEEKIWKNRNKRKTKRDERRNIKHDLKHSNY